jgi:hypothetical protein
MTTLTISARWDRANEPAANEIDATLCDLLINIGKTAITEYRDGARKTTRHIHTPAYFLSEWFAENWWALLHEPRKDEEGDDRDFLARHSLLSAQHGFALPALEIVPVGRAIHVSTNRYQSKLASAEFTNVAVADLSREDFQTTLASFVNACVERLGQRAISGTPLETSWHQVSSTQPDEEPFCQLVGSLGLSPYNLSEETARAVDRLEGALGFRAARDFCLAANEEDLLKTISAVDSMAAWMDAAADITLKPFERPLPPDNFNAPSWRRGLNGARAVLSTFDVNINDPQGADKVFDRFHIDPSRTANFMSRNDQPDLPFSAAIHRSSDSAKVALLQKEDPRRRFAAARSLYLAWASEDTATRLATDAITRDQQASRQFAAEILVPRKFLESQASHGVMHAHTVYEIARARRASTEVVRLQARNAGIQISSI